MCDISHKPIPNNRPDLSKIRFGCTAYSHIPKEKRQKLDWKSKCLIFVGYANNGYRLWDKENRGIEISRNVVFEESRTTNDTLKTVITAIPSSIDIQCTKDSDEINVTTDEEPQTNCEDDKCKEDTASQSEEEGLEFNEEEGLEVNTIEIEDSDNVSGEQITVRRSSRQKKTPNRYTAHIASMVCEEIPQTIEDLKSRDDWPNWKRAIKNEMESLEENENGEEPRNA